MNESTDDRTLRLIGQLTSSETEYITKWGKIPGKIAIVCSHSSIKQVNARLALAMSVNCLARVDPLVTNLDIVIPDNTSKINAPLFDGNDMKTCIASFTNQLRPKVKIRVLDHLKDNYDGLLSIGNTEYEHSFKVSIASDGWLAFASPKSLSTDFTDNINPVGAYAAANLGCLEVFKKVFVKKADLIIPKKSDYDFRWNTKLLQIELMLNTFDYSVDKKNINNPSLPKVINVGELVTAGIGAGGGACLYTLVSVPFLEGIFYLIDPDEVKPSNLNRYIYATHFDADVNKPKVDAMKGIILRHRHCTVEPYHIPYTKFSEQLNGKPIDLLISTVDTRQTRVDIQWDLPRIILDAAVAGTWFYINRIEFGNNACLGCRFYQNGSSDSIEIRLSKIIGLPADVIASLRASNSPIETRHIETMKPFSEKYNFPLPEAGERFQDWFVYHCSEIPVDGQLYIQIPVPFATVMPGILLAGEVIKQRYFKDYTNRDYFSYDVFGIPTNLLEGIKKRKDCPICSNQSTLDRYRQKNGILRR